MVIFIESYNGKSKTSGKDYHRITLAECKADEQNKVTGYVKVFFTEKPLNVESLNFGDVVEVKFSEPQQLGGNPVLTDVVKIMDTPYA